MGPPTANASVKLAATLDKADHCIFAAHVVREEVYGTNQQLILQGKASAESLPWSRVIKSMQLDDKVIGYTSKLCSSRQSGQ